MEKCHTQRKKQSAKTKVEMDQDVGIRTDFKQATIIIFMDMEIH